MHAYTKDPQMLQKAKRPCVMLMNLKYRGRRYTFAIPLRSNIAPNVPKWQYYPLPPRKTTKDRYRHGLHYIKMFPIRREDADLYHTENNMYAALIKAELELGEKEIIKDCQAYLDRYATGEHPMYSTDIDYLITLV